MIRIEHPDWSADQAEKTLREEIRNAGRQSARDFRAGSAFERWAFKNRRPLTVGETPIWLAPPEYVIIHKLEFYREGRSEKHLRDIRGMLAVTDVDHAGDRATRSWRCVAEMYLIF